MATSNEMGRFFRTPKGFIGWDNRQNQQNRRIRHSFQVAWPSNLAHLYAPAIFDREGTLAERVHQLAPTWLLVGHPWSEASDEGGTEINRLQLPQVVGTGDGISIDKQRFGADLPGYGASLSCDAMGGRLHG